MRSVALFFVVALVLLAGGFVVEAGGLRGATERVCSLVGCSPGPERVGTLVEKQLEHQLKTDPALSRLALSVRKLQVIHETGNRYKGVATIVGTSLSREIPLSIVADYSTAIYEIPAGAFLPFMVSRPVVAPWPTVRPLIEHHDVLNDQCRGGRGGLPETDKTCAERDALGAQIRAAGWCWGHAADAGYQRRWVECAPGD